MKTIKKKLKNLFVRLKIFSLRRNEIRKFKDEKRKKIYSKVNLTAKQKKEIDDVYKTNYGYKIPYTWHRYFTAFQGHFDKYFFPELLYIPEFEYFENLNRDYCVAFQDKNVLPLLASIQGIKTPEVIISCSFGVYHDANYKYISKADALKILDNVGECFIKPTIESNSGRGCHVLNIQKGIDTKTGNNISDIIHNVGDNFVIQRLIVCHEQIRKLHPDSCNTFRVITYRWKDDILYIPSIIRIGRGGNFLDNAHAGGMFCAIDDDGTLHKKAVTEFQEEFEYHPDTKIRFDKYKIDLFPKVLDDAKKMHQAIPEIGVVNWDFTIDSKGNPVLIEANLLSGTIWFCQMAHGVAPFGKLTPEILRWISYMKKCSIDERKKHMFGNMK